MLTFTTRGLIGILHRAIAFESGNFSLAGVAALFMRLMRVKEARSGYLLQHRVSELQSARSGASIVLMSDVVASPLSQTDTNKF